MSLPLLKLVIELPLVAIGAVLVAWHRARHPWRPSRLERWVYAREKRTVIDDKSLLPAERASRIDALRREVDQAPRSEQSFAAKLRHELLVYGVPLLLVVAWAIIDPLSYI